MAWSAPQGADLPGFCKEGLWLPIESAGSMRRSSSRWISSLMRPIRLLGIAVLLFFGTLYRLILSDCTSGRA